MSFNQHVEDVFREALFASVNGPFFLDWEFYTLFGLTRSEVSAVLEEWPAALDTKEGKLAIANAVNNLTGYPMRDKENWSKYLSVSPEELKEVYEQWCSIRN